MQAVEAPRIHHQWMPDILTYEHEGLHRGVADDLLAMGSTP